MKTLILISSICLFNRIYSQNIFPSFTDNPRWNVSEWFWDESSLHQYRYLYDTLLCGQEYSVASPYHFFVRTEGEKVLIKLNDNCDEPEHILYDFGLEIGDKIWIPGPYEPFDSMQLRTDNIDTAVYFGVSRRRLEMAYNRCGGLVEDDFFNTMYWIEGIGSDLHPFYNGYCFCDACETGAVLTCYDSSGIQLYGTASEFSCEIIVGISHLNRESFKLFPNPSGDNFTIETTLPEINYGLIYDYRGSLITTVLINGSTTIPAADFKPGIYLIEVRDLSNALKGRQLFTKI